ncbi:MAG: hypothetical protein LBT82_03690 [Oscillospiraceae bacterium]|jgi:shikimate kinase|nr:hypothetical protein [Oscillospiraceae bacterium]
MSLSKFVSALMAVNLAFSANLNTSAFDPPGGNWSAYTIPESDYEHPPQNFINFNGIANTMIGTTLSACLLNLTRDLPPVKIFSLFYNHAVRKWNSYHNGFRTLDEFEKIFEKEIKPSFIGHDTTLNNIREYCKTFLENVKMYNQKSNTANSLYLCKACIFCGPSGVGKTKLANSLAKALFKGKHLYLSCGCGGMASNREGIFCVDSDSSIFSMPYTGPSSPEFRFSAPLCSEIMLTIPEHLEQQEVALIVLDEYDKMGNNNALENFVKALLDDGGMFVKIVGRSVKIPIKHVFIIGITNGRKEDFLSLEDIDSTQSQQKDKFQTKKSESDQDQFANMSQKQKKNFLKGMNKKQKNNFLKGMNQKQKKNHKFDQDEEVQENELQTEPKLNQKKEFFQRKDAERVIKHDTSFLNRISLFFFEKLKPDDYFKITKNYFDEKKKYYEEEYDCKLSIDMSVLKYIAFIAENANRGVREIEDRILQMFNSVRPVCAALGGKNFFAPHFIFWCDKKGDIFLDFNTRYECENTNSLDESALIFEEYESMKKDLSKNKEFKKIDKKDVFVNLN